MHVLVRSRLPGIRPKLLLPLVLVATLLVPAPAAAAGTTAWQNGAFAVDTPNLVRRSSVVLQRPNTAPSDSLPLGNGALGAAVWAADGFTAQLNRTDTFPDRKSLGQLVIPGLSRLTTATDFKGTLDLYDGMLHQSGGGMTLTAFVRADTQQLVVDVTGADPNTTQTAQVKLWSGRSPQARAAAGSAALAETWVDNNGAGASGRTFGSLAGITAGGRSVVASTPNNLTGQVSFQPNTDGSFRVVVAAPTWTGGDSIATTNAVLNGAAQGEVRNAHLQWWHNYWSSAGLIKISSADGTGDYVENLRTRPSGTSPTQPRIGDNSALGRRTFTSRSYVNSHTWSYDSLHAARLGMAPEVKASLLAATRQFQVYPSGLASFTAQPASEPYIEQSGVLATAVPEALAQDYDGLLRIAPAWPADWTGEGTVAIGHKSRVHVQISGGTPTTVAITSGANQQLAVRSPWPGQSVTVLDGQTRTTVVAAQSNATFTIPAQAGRSYLVEKTGSAVQPFQALTGTPATAARRYDRVTIGLPPATPGTGTISLRARANGKYVTAGTATPLIADSTTIGTAQQFELADLGGGNVSLKAKANGLFVAADNAGAAALIANRTAIGPWEQFDLITN